MPRGVEVPTAPKGLAKVVPARSRTIRIYFVRSKQAATSERVVSAANVTSA